MRIDFSVVRNFRNFSPANTRPELRITWEPGINLILGPNGSGKTNLLESLSILSGWGAFGRTQNVISWDSQNMPAFAGCQASGEESAQITANITSRISLRLDGKAITSTDLRLVIPSILFLTGNVNLIDGSPSSRRMFIDRLCALFYPPYAKRLADFRYILRTRTVLLRQGRSPERTTVPYCDVGGWIMDRRREAAAQLMQIAQQEKFRLYFVPELNISGSEYLRERLRVNYAKELQAFRPQDGPSYDDLAITLNSNGRPASEALSRGQKRRLILSLLVSAGRLTAHRMKRDPVMLFDDLTAELDAQGREFVYTELAKTGWQVFITAPENPFKSFGKCRIVDFTSQLQHTGSFLDK
ncbi:MAG: DNA replication/repair protein RecF [Synergistaceae bacterium]|nr:DNA replication/repair protein RecF [Synergistaceae bacterium]